MKDKRLYLLLLASFLVHTSASANSTVEYYINLINDEIARSHTHPKPTDSSEFKPNSLNVSVYGFYDYIIVGAGSAGAVIASRLSEIPENHVLLLEAGGDESDFSNIPAMANYLVDLEFNWNYNTTRQTTACLAYTNQECRFHRGKALGGTSAINTLNYVRGNKEDYNSWFRQGNPGWSYKDVLPFFIKSENSCVDGDEGYHGKGGYLNVEYVKSESPQYTAFIEANLELGRNVVDYNGREQLGIAKMQVNTINGKRDSTNKAFLKPAEGRKNLKILPHSLVIKILIDFETKKAYGVLFSHGGQLYIAKAIKEVIISAGAVGSPQLLMLSGIGPRNHLRKLGIPAVHSLAVGNNLQEHVAYFGLQFVTNYTEPSATLRKMVEEYLNGYGPLTSATNSQAIGFFQTKLAKVNGAPDIELLMVPSKVMTDETYNSNPSNSFSIGVLLLHPKSHGEIRLKSNNPFEYPLIDPKPLTDPNNEDIETIYEGIKLALGIVDTKAFRKLNASLVYAPLPECRKYDYLSKDYWYCQIRQLSSLLFHPVGTCKMGPDPRKGAVVNHELKVHGIWNLRVADASVIPDIVSAHTNAACIMIGEKLSHMIINENKYG
ncbi:hypothetical protein ILUMI_10428 [Ignelater luminosus]|uniref:Glucose-methanol-choline oxidoreductase N-terminal domain-containing protein n=1 Tax=Ignelater luminosus TaxID=2038154 RepID=A0A8K0D3Y2_IGNLU|nr:hypothetical protein ILUMI_10428 [Ignelater luminosus]